MAKTDIERIVQQAARVDRPAGSFLIRAGHLEPEQVISLRRRFVDARVWTGVIEAGRLDGPTSLFQALAKVERQYPRDYRFPYERAKLAVRSSQASSRTEAFKALNSAAEKAISTGKANEMLNGLETDKAGDFSKLAQGRYEWSRLVAALKRKDPSLLGE